MKELLRISWILLIHYISCLIAGLETSIILFIIAIVMIWYVIFSSINYMILKHKNVKRNKDVSPLIYMAISIPALFHPLLAVFICMVLPVYRLCITQGITIGDRPLREQFVFDRRYQSEPLPDESESRDNITAGLPMCGTLEPAGNPYGVWGTHYPHNGSDS